MSLHSNIFGWDYVWRDYAESRQGELFFEGNKETGEIIALCVPCGDTIVTFTPTPAGTTAAIGIAPSPFYFSIYREKPLHQLNKALGMQDIVIGAKDFDSRYIIKSNAEDITRALFQDSKLRELILQEDASTLGIVDGDAQLDPRWVIKPGHAALVYSRAFLMDKFDQLENVFSLLNLVLTQLESLSPAVNRTAEQAEEPVPSTAPRRLHSPLLDMN